MTFLFVVIVVMMLVVFVLYMWLETLRYKRAKAQIHAAMAQTKKEIDTYNKTNAQDTTLAAKEAYQRLKKKQLADELKRQS
jgi:uncharacterized protein YpmB